MMISTSPTGKLVFGTVLDVGRKSLERTLQDYDSQLYLAWNSKKLRGWGCWEVRRRNAHKSVYDLVTLPSGQGTIVDLRYCENDLVNHVLDAPYLNYKILTHLKAMDRWSENTSFYVDRLESAEKSRLEAAEAERTDKKRYALKQYKKIIGDIRQMVLSGWNPAEMADHWDKVPKV